jgi:hypothetical protein
MKRRAQKYLAQGASEFVLPITERNLAGLWTESCLSHMAEDFPVSSPSRRDFVRFCRKDAAAWTGNSDSGM